MTVALADLFPPGLPVEMTPAAIDQGLQGPRRLMRGVIVHVDGERGRLRVQREKERGSTWYSADYWRPVRPEFAVLADWLEDNGEAAAAAKVRAQFC